MVAIKSEIDYTRLRDALEKVSHFEESEWERFRSLIEVRRLKKKEFVFQEGEIVRTLAFVNKGCLRHFLLDDKGEEHIVYFAFENWWVGDLNSFFHVKPTLYYLQALEDCELFLFSKTNFERALEEIPAFRKFFQVTSNRSYMSVQKRYAEAFSRTAEQKYLDLLETNPNVLQRVPQKYIASFLGIKPQSLSRIRKQLQK